MDELVDRFTRWAEGRADVVGAALVGSHARGDARPDSDVDLMIVTVSAHAYVTDTDWVETFGEPQGVAVEQWGTVTSVRVHYADGTKVEFGVTTPEWVQTSPVDPGTARVVRDGFRILLDRSRVLLHLDEAVRQEVR